MALVECPECTKQISDQAGACPHCGYALSAPAPAGVAYKDGSSYVTNQGTSKSLKLQGLLAAILMGVSFAMLFSNPEQSNPIWSLGVTVGLIWYLVTRVMRWWRHA